MFQYAHACYSEPHAPRWLGPGRSSNIQSCELSPFLFFVQACSLPYPDYALPVPSVWSGQRVKDPRWGTQDRGPIRPLCGEWTPAPFIIPFQLKPSKKWLNNQLQANGAIYPCYGRTLVIGLGMSGQCQMSHSNAKRVRQMTESRRREQSNEKQSKRNAH